MMRLKLVFFLLICSSLMACQGVEKETVRQIVTESAPAPEMEDTGGVDGGGGGNGMGGLSLEDFNRRMEEIPAFAEVVLPIIKNVAKTHPRFASDMAHIAYDRIWYFVPGKLKSLKAKDIGVSIADEELQQLARQNLSSIYIDGIQFQAMATKEIQASLLLHEIIMGVRLMDNQSKKDNCYSEIAYLKLDEVAQKSYSKLRQECDLRYGFNRPPLGSDMKKIKLSSEDYDNIRELGVRLKRTQGEIENLELSTWIVERQFRNYEN